MRLPRRRWLWLLAPLVTAVVGLGWWRAVVVERQTRRELEELRVRRQELEEANRVLERAIRALKTEREARARAAREALDVAAPGEVVVIVPTPTPTLAKGAQ
ncbi:MAG TPA: septum formation initiator family protein [Thermoanaerobaculaceae bacterium]|nr:septum formation initiator family protein [Thermoanaerobaculaceae bacterium]